MPTVRKADGRQNFERRVLLWQKAQRQQRHYAEKGESERAGGGYDYRWTQNGERRVIYAPTLQELREKKRKSLPMFSEA